MTARRTADEEPRFTGYATKRRLGEGTWGVVYLAERDADGEKVAIKLLRRQFCVDIKSLRRFNKEAAIATSLALVGDTTNVVRYTGFSSYDEPLKGRPPIPRPYIVMEYVGGGNLVNWLEEQRTVVIPEVCQIVAGAARGAHCFHESTKLDRTPGIHGDIKPANILLKGRVAKLSDFGAWKMIDSGDRGRFATPSGVMGTPLYMPPEILEGREEDIGAWSDVYSLGVVLLEALTRQSPATWEAGTVRPKKLPTTINPIWPRELNTACHRCLAINHKERYETAAELADVLEGVAKQLRVKIASPPVPPRPVKPITDDSKQLANLPEAPPRPAVAPRPLRRAWLYAVIATVLLAVGVSALALKLWPGGGGTAATEPSTTGTRASPPDGDNGVRGSGKSSPTPKAKDDPPSPPVARGLPKRLTVTLPGGVVIEFAFIDPTAQEDRGEFALGTSEGNRKKIKDKGWAFPPSYTVDEGPHAVRLTRPYFLAVMETTVSQYNAFLAADPWKPTVQTNGWWWPDPLSLELKQNKDPATRAELGRRMADPIDQLARANNTKLTGKGFANDVNASSANRPVVNVTWHDAQAMGRWVGEAAAVRKQLGDALGDRRWAVGLPTETRWEYACRAGRTTLFPWGDDPDDAVKGATKYANLADMTARKLFPGWRTTNTADGFVFSAPKDGFEPNPFGLYHMTGNVWEWCDDAFAPYAELPGGPDPVQTRSRTEPVERILRGGSCCCFNDGPDICRTALRYKHAPEYYHCNIGFRLCLSID